MEDRRSPLILNLWPSFGDVAFLLPITLLFGCMGGVKALLGDCDTGWHIRTGEWIVANHMVPAHDLFSYSKPDAPWFAWEWLSDVLFAWLNGLGGLRAVVMFTILLLSITFGLLFRLTRGKSNPIVATLVTFMAAAASAVHWLARPHLFTLLFVVLFYGALLEVDEGRTRLAGIPYLAILPVATVVWTNLHGGFFVGILMIAVYGAGEVLKMALSADRAGWRAGRGKAGRYFLSALGCLAASLINPYTFRLHQHMLAYMRDPFTSQHIIEFLSPSFHGPMAIFFESLLVLAAAAACRSCSQGRFTEPLLLLMWAHAALLAGRNIPIFAIAAAVPAAHFVQEWLNRVPESNAAEWLRAAVGSFNRLAARTGEVMAGGSWHVAGVAAVVFVAAVIWAPNPPRKFRAEFDPQRYPSGALATLRDEPSARIFTDDEWGDYLIWSLYPSQKVFVDGRSDFYGDDFEEKYIDVLNVRYDWEQILSGFDVDTILMPINAPLSGALKESSRWHVVFDDGVALVFRSAGRKVASRQDAQHVNDRGTSSSVARTGNGPGRDREVTKTQSSDRAITVHQFKT
ncbi:MAG TPA: hypothetical protein VGH38_29560 [Bryobacteraceae bacterium]|jgi:hypothetical protein